MKTVVVIHTGPTTIQPLKQEFLKQLPGVRIINIMDDSLLSDVMAAGYLTEAVSARLLSYMQQGEKMGATALLNACSSIGEAASAASLLIGVPIIKIDDTMAGEAVNLGKKIGVVATVKTTLDPTIRLIRLKALAANKDVEIIDSLAEGAFISLVDGKPELHDEIVKRTIETLASKVDVIVLAQVSMARLLIQLEGIKVPVLSSPQSGVKAVSEVLASL